MVILGAVADSDNKQVFKLGGVIAEFPRALAPGPYLRENGNPSIPSMPENLGYDVTARPYVLTNFGGGER